MLRALGPAAPDARRVGSRAQRVLLAALVLDRGQVVSAERLAELVWGDAQPANPAASLQSHVSRLRKVLPPAVALRAEGAGYRLDAEAGGVDVDHFEAALRRARAADVHARPAIVAEALSLWRGTPYADLDDDPRAAAEATRLAELAQALREVRAVALLEGGQALEAVAELEAQRRADPLRERTVELLMRAQVEVGRKPDALRVYQELRAVLGEELGLEPSPELRRLETAILTETIVAGAPPAAPGGPSAPPGHPPADAEAAGRPGSDADTARTPGSEADADAARRPGPDVVSAGSARTARADGGTNRTDWPGEAVDAAHANGATGATDVALDAAGPRLPSSTFIGRATELAQLGELLERQRIVTIVGPGGVGKTRLALHAAAAAGRRLPVTVVELAPLRDADQLADFVASAVGAQPGASPLERLLTALGARSRLLLVDNCEHVVDAAAALVDAVVNHTDGVVVLATSREPLNVDGEVIVRLPPLAVDGPAVELFVDRAAAFGHGLGADLAAADRAVVEAICRRLDGLPLALELAAARLATMSLHDLSEGLSQRFEVLNRGRRTAQERHRSLRSLVEWSVRSLDPDLRTVLARLSVFAGPFTVDAAATVCGEAQAAMADHLADLVERSLLVCQPNSGPGRSTTRARFTFLETIRLYAADLLAVSGSVRTYRDRHADWALSILSAVSPADSASATGGEAAGPVLAPELALPELAELRLAHRHLMASDDADRALRLARDLHYLALLAMQAEAFGWVIETAERFGDVDHPDAEAVLGSAATGAWQSGDLEAAARWAARAETVAARSRWPGAGAAAGEALGDVGLLSGDHRRALEHWERAVARSRDAAPERVVSRLSDLALAASYVGDHERAAGAVAEARRRLGTSTGWIAAWVDYAEGETLAEVDPARAIELLSRAVDCANASGADFISGVAGLTLASLQVRTGDAIGALPRLAQLIGHWRRGGAWVQVWITLRTAIEAFVALDDLPAAALLLGAVEASGAEAEPTGADAVRLQAARATVEAGLAEPAAHLARGAAFDRSRLVDHTLTRLSKLTSALAPR